MTDFKQISPIVFSTIAFALGLTATVTHKIITFKESASGANGEIDAGAFAYEIQATFGPWSSTDTETYTCGDDLDPWSNDDRCRAQQAGLILGIVGSFFAAVLSGALMKIENYGIWAASGALSLVGLLGYGLAFGIWTDGYVNGDNLDATIESNFDKTLEYGWYLILVSMVLSLVTSVIIFTVGKPTYTFSH